jgi:hypothetical protein
MILFKTTKIVEEKHTKNVRSKCGVKGIKFYYDAISVAVGTLIKTPDKPHL